MMKWMLSVLMALLLAISPALAETAETAVVPGNRLGLEVLARIYDGVSNQFVSPVSLAWALSMAASGAAGETRNELLRALEAGDAADVATWRDALAAAGLRWANAAFVKDDLDLLPGYADGLARDFDAGLFPLDDAARVNAWVDEKTDHLIDHLVDDIDPETRLMLVNAIAMDAKWRAPFAEYQTWQDVFHAPDGDLDADFMHKTHAYDYGERDGAQAIRLDYADSELRMYVVLPPEDGVAQVLDGLREEGLAWLGELRQAEVSLALPKLDAAVSNGLSDSLKALGIESAFAEGADFSGISDEALMISEALQKVRVQMDEEGTRAAAATTAMMANAAAPFDREPPVEMTVNRPYIVLIVEETTGAIAFAGVVSNPAA